MTEQTENAAPINVLAKKKRKLVLPIAAVILALSVGGFLASRAGMDKALVKQKLDEAIAQAQEEARAKGRDLSITYGEIEVVGSFARKHVLVHGPVMLVKPLEGQEKKPLPSGAQKEVDALRITTEVMEIYPESVDLSAVRMELPKPIDVADAQTPKKNLLKVEASAPHAISFAQEKEAEVAYSRVRYAVPAEMNLTYLREQQAKGTEDMTPEVIPVYETLQVKMDAGATVENRMANDKSGLGSSKVSIKNMTLMPKEKPDQLVTIGGIVGEWSNSLNAQKQNSMKAKVNLGPLSAAPEVFPYAPVSFELDASYDGAVPNSPEAVATVQSQQSVFALNSLSLTSKEAALTASGNFTAGAADALPVGKATLTMSNLPYVLGELRTYRILTPENEPMVLAMLQQIAGTPVEQITDLNVVVERVKDGAFTIGQAKFEELFATMLKHAMMQKQGASAPVPAPQLPDADKPKAAPIAVPDAGTRG